jgi:hypothetical protein
VTVKSNPVPIIDLLNGAKAAIDAGEKFLHVAAESIAKAAEQGATQRQIAAAVGKSQPWVNGLLQWRIAGYPETAFGPQKEASRARVIRRSDQKTEQKTGSSRFLVGRFGHFFTVRASSRSGFSV